MLEEKRRVRLQIHASMPFFEVERNRTLLIKEVALTRRKLCGRTTPGTPRITASRLNSFLRGMLLMLQHSILPLTCNCQENQRILGHPSLRHEAFSVSSYHAVEIINIHNQIDEKVFVSSSIKTATVLLNTLLIKSITPRFI